MFLPNHGLISILKSSPPPILCLCVEAFRRATDHSHDFKNKVVDESLWCLTRIYVREFVDIYSKQVRSITCQLLVITRTFVYQNNYFSTMILRHRTLYISYFPNII